VSPTASPASPSSLCRPPSHEIAIAGLPSHGATAAGSFPHGIK
jgi:hypothetical protein